MTKRQRGDPIEALLAVCVAKYRKLLPADATDFTLADDDADALATLTDQLAVKLMGRAQLFAEHRAKVKGAKRLKRAKVALTVDDVECAWKTLDQ